MILVIGCGHVGNTIANNLSNVIKIDPKLNDNKIEDFIYDGAVICLPTPTVDGHCDDSLIEETIDRLGNKRILIKSTVLPNLLDKYGDNVVYSPEFLREAHAEKDYQNNRNIIWGGKREQIDWWITKFHFEDRNNMIMTRKDASVVKYIYNCFLATKVAVFHEIYSKLDSSYNYHNIINTLAEFENIGPSHMKVRNLGYDGACFPKDMEAFANFLDSEILKNVIEVNRKLIEAR
jgi:UDP-glucose 6-dehydrogenase